MFAFPHQPLTLSPPLPLPLPPSVAGTAEGESAQKKGYKLPRHIMSNGDLARIINSDEVQSVVAPQKASKARAPLKKNPLRNLGALLKLNPYAKAARRMELLASAQRAGAKADKVEAARAARAAERKAVKPISKAFLAKMVTDSGGCCAAQLVSGVRWGHLVGLFWGCLGAWGV
jgi:large subunit ribosomal protein L4e